MTERAREKRKRKTKTKTICHWTPLQNAFLAYCARRISGKKTTFWLNTLFGVNIRHNTIENHARRLGIAFGLAVNTGQFQKGSTPWNKGLKGFRPSPETIWKKGHGCWWKARPIGTERKGKDGIQVKVTMESGPRNKVWRNRSHLVWEKEMGAIPKGSYVLHINGNKFDDRIENLILMSQAELALLNSKFNTLKFNQLPEEARLTAIYKAKLMATKHKLTLTQGNT